MSAAHSQGLTLAYELYACPMGARISPRQCEVNRERYAKAKKRRGGWYESQSAVDRLMFSKCEGCPGVLALAESQTIRVAVHERKPKAKKKRRKVSSRHALAIEAQSRHGGAQIHPPDGWVAIEDLARAVGKSQNAVRIAMRKRTARCFARMSRRGMWWHPEDAEAYIRRCRAEAHAE